MKCAFKWARKRQAGWYRRSLSKLLSLHLQRQELFLFPVSAPKRKLTEKEQNTMENRNIPYKIYLDEADMPQAWYNLRADMKHKPAPLLNPGTGYFDMTAYQAFNDGKMTDYIPSESAGHGIKKRYDNSSPGYKAGAAVALWAFQIDTAVFAPEAASGSLSVIAFWNSRISSRYV